MRVGRPVKAAQLLFCRLLALREGCIEADEPSRGSELSSTPRRENHGAQRLDRRGAGQGPFPRFLGFTVAVAAKRAMVPPAYLGPWTKVVRWPGMKIIWRRVSVTPQRKERLVKPGPPSKPWPRRTQASPTAWPSPGGQHLGPLTQCAWVLRHGRQCHETYHRHR